MAISRQHHDSLEQRWNIHPRRVKHSKVNGRRTGWFLGFCFCQQAVRCSLDRLGESRKKFGLWQPWWNRVEEFDNDGSRPPQETSPRPEQARVERNRHARDGKRLVEQNDSGLVVGRRSRRPPCPFREDNDLPSVGDALLGF